MSYSNNPRSILAGTGITVTPATGTGANVVTIAATATGILAVRIATVTPVVFTNADNVVDVQVPGSVPVAVTLPAGVLGRQFSLKDGLGLATVAAPITVIATAGTIDGAASAVINVPFGSLTFVYNGVQWIIV